MLSDSIDIAIIAIVNYYHNSESAFGPVTIVGLWAMETAHSPMETNQLLVMSFLVLTLDTVDLPLPKTV